MVIERKVERMIGNGAEVISNLTVIFADVFERSELEGADRHGIKIDHARLRLDLGAPNRDRRLGGHAVIEASDGAKSRRKSSMYMAPPMHSSRRSGSCCKASGRRRPAKTSEKYSSPPGFSTRKISANTRSFSATD